MRTRHDLSRFTSTAALCAALGAGIFAAGCASSPTHSSFGETVDDSVITSKVKAAFVEDPQVSALNIKVETYKGTVQLSGFANSATEMMRAAEIASNVKGVKSVKNDIRLKTAG
jgi:osmotically-inducible protein OsmY